MNDPLIVALDVPTLREALDFVDSIPSVQCFKVGLEAYAAGHGDTLRAELKARGKRVMVDLKLHDIPETVRRAVESLRGRADLVTVHASALVMEAAQKGSGGEVNVLAVTVLTSMTDADLVLDGCNATVRQLVASRAILAERLGLYGVVASPQEVTLVRSVAPGLKIVTPGVRPVGSAMGDDQRRVGTPLGAILDGAHHLVVGRPIRDAHDRPAAVDAILAEILLGQKS